MHLFQSTFFFCCVCQLITSLEIEQFFHRQKRQLDWNNGVDYRFDHVAISSNRDIRRHDDGSENSNVVYYASSEAKSPEGVPGEPGIDYPILPSIPLTNFHCRGRVPGYYGDTETACQVFHMCDVSGRQDSFLCPNGTIFSQILFSCDWWYNVQCAGTRQHYELNQNLYKGSEINVYGTPSFWNWLSEIDDETSNTERDEPARPAENNDTPETREELPVAQPLVSQQPQVARQQHNRLPSVVPVTPRPTVNTSSQRPVMADGWIPLASTSPSTTSTPKPVVIIKKVDPVARKRSPIKLTQSPENIAATPSADEWWKTGFMRDYRLPNFGWARENLFPADQGTTPELAWMDIGPNGPLMEDKHVKIKPTIVPQAQTDHGRNVIQTNHQVDSIQPTQTQKLKPINHAPKQIQDQKLTVKPQVALHRPSIQQSTRPAKKFPTPAPLTPANHAPKYVNKHLSQALETQQITTTKPTTTTATTDTLLDFLNDDDSTLSNDDGKTTLQKNQVQVVVKAKKLSNNRTRLAIPASPVFEAKQHSPLSWTKSSASKRANAPKSLAKSTNPWLQHPRRSTTQKIHSRASNVITRTEESQATQAPNVKRGKPIHQQDTGISRKQDPFAGVVMERVSAPFRPSTPLVPPVASANSQLASRQQIARTSSVPLADARFNRPATKRSRNANAFDPRLDRPYRQEHPIWKILNWESTRM